MNKIKKVKKMTRDILKIQKIIKLSIQIYLYIGEPGALRDG